MEVSLCRDRLGVFNATFFRLWSCSMCYTYLFQDSNPAFFSRLPDGHQLVSLQSSTSSFPAQDLRVSPDVDDEDAVRTICSTMEGEDCERWQRCCRAAELCCRQQILTPLPGRRAVRGPISVEAKQVAVSGPGFPSDSETGHAEGSYVVRTGPTTIASSSGNRFEAAVEGTSQVYCPRTWDGFGCFQDTLAGRTASISCPSYISHSDPYESAYKRCTENGTWWREEQTLQEWTDYTACVPIDDFRAVHHAAVTCSVISLLLLVPSCAIFLSYRKLRSQHRVQIHLHLFLSFIITNVVWILWENLVYNDRLHNQDSDSLLRKDTVGCKVLYVLTRYSLMSNFCWMFLEGFHLHRLIVRAFETPKSILAYYVVGWGCTWVPVLVYVIIRAVRKDSGCWVRNIKGFEWILYTPNLLCIVVNLFFLLSILRILLTQLQSHPNEPSNYRRALKATGVLVPLFGLHLFLTIYSPPVSRQVANVYEIFAAVVKNSQGAIVAIIFCFMNKEVLAQLKESKRRYNGCLRRKDPDMKGLSTNTYVMTDRQGQGRYGADGALQDSKRGRSVSVATRLNGSCPSGNGSTVASYV